jgi:hypothetical protein
MNFGISRLFLTHSIIITMLAKNEMMGITMIIRPKIDEIKFAMKEIHIALQKPIESIFHRNNDSISTISMLMPTASGITRSGGPDRNVKVAGAMLFAKAAAGIRTKASADRLPIIALFRN